MLWHNNRRKGFGHPFLKSALLVNANNLNVIEIMRNVSVILFFQNSVFHVFQLYLLFDS